MYVVDDICYAGSPAEEIRIVEAKPLQGGMLLVSFTSGEKRLFDTTAIEGSAFEPLRQGIAHETVSVFHGFPTWLEGQIDLTPEYVYEHSIAYDEVPEEFGYC